MQKFSYPVGNGSPTLSTSYDIPRWMTAMQKIYSLAAQGYDKEQSIQAVTNEWDEMEIKDFKHWMSFYEESAHTKYKTADTDRYLPVGNSMIPMDALKSSLSGPDVSMFPPAPAQTAANKKVEIDKKIRSIIARLNAAEKLATDPDVQKDLQQFLDIGVPKWLEELHRVKRLIQVIPIRSAISLDDVIVKEANKWEFYGFPKTARIMRVFAQENDGDSTEKAINEIIEGMNPQNEDEDENEADDLATFSVTAQEAPVPKIPPMAKPLVPPTAPSPTAPSLTAPSPTAPSLTAPSPTLAPPTEVKTDIIDDALKHVTVSEVVSRLEALANIFRNREISRQLAIIDLMMDKLGIASFFPSLAEASSKSLESNQYALSRIEDILSKLRGSLETPLAREIELTEDKKIGLPVPAVAPEVIQQNLSTERDAEAARKAKKKQDEITAAEPPPPPTPMPPVEVKPGPAPIV